MACQLLILVSINVSEQLATSRKYYLKKPSSFCAGSLKSEKLIEFKIVICTADFSYVQVVVHDRDVKADVVHAVGWDVKDDGLVVGGIERVLFDAGLLLLQTSPVTY